jgi:hypothetical protein
VLFSLKYAGPLAEGEEAEPAAEVRRRSDPRGPAEALADFTCAARRVTGATRAVCSGGVAGVHGDSAPGATGVRKAEAVCAPATVGVIGDTAWCATGDDGTGTGKGCEAAVADTA